MVFVNPGTMLISVEQFFAGGTSICRNFGLQKMFSFIGYVERAGSGADTITKGWKENNWPKPQIREIYDLDRVEMVLSLDALDAQANVGSDTDDDTNNETNTSVLTSSVIAKHLGVSTITIKRDLAKMTEMGLIKHIGPSYGGHWEVLK